MAASHRSTHSFRSSEVRLELPSPTVAFKPDEPAWSSVCESAGTKYRGYIQPFTTPKGERLEAVVLFNDRLGLATGLSLSEFSEENVRKRANERHTKPAETRLTLTASETWNKVLLVWRARRAAHD